MNRFADIQRVGLGRRSVAAMKWTLTGQILSSAVRFLGLAVLARLLQPSDYGIFGMAFLFVGMFSEVIQTSFSRALVQSEQLTADRIRGALVAAMVCGVVTLAALSFCAAPVAVFFRQPRLLYLLPVMATSVPIAAMAAPSRALLQRAYRFKTLMMLDTVALGAGNYAIGIALAILGFGYWALAFGQVGQAVLSLALCYSFTRHSIVPSWTWSKNREIMKYSAGFSLTSFGSYLGRNIDNLVVGKAMGEIALGNYGRAFNLFTLPVNMLGNALGEVLFPGFAVARSEPVRIKRAYLNALNASAVLMMPLSVFICLLAGDLVRVVLGEKWGGAAAPLSMLALSLYPRFAYKISETMSTASGAVYGTAWRQIIYAGLVFVGALAGTKYGLPGVATGVSIAITGFFFVSAQLANRIAGVSWQEFASAHRHGIASTSIVGLCAWVGQTFIVPSGALVALGVLIVTMVASLAGLVLAIRRAPRFFIGDGIQLILAHAPPSVSRVLGCHFNERL